MLFASDVEMFQHIINNATSNPISSIEMGDRLCFEPNLTVVYEVSNIGILKLWNDTEDLKYGVDLSNCDLKGSIKEQLFKVKIEITKV